MNILSFRTFLASFAFLLLISSCTREGEYFPPSKIKEWTIPLSAKNENPNPVNRNETGTALLELFSDNSLRYTITVEGLASGDQLQAAHLHAGNAITNGGVILDFAPTFSGNSATGTVFIPRQSLLDSLNTGKEIYLNVHSTQVGTGLVRGQVNTTSEFSMDVPLSGANEVPANPTAATGVAMIRVTADKKLYVNITTTGLEADDEFRAAHIHTGATGVNGPVLVGLYSSAAEFGTTKTITLDDATLNSIKNDALYVNLHSKNFPAGIIRGQIR